MPFKSPVSISSADDSKTLRSKLQQLILALERSQGKAQIAASTVNVVSSGGGGGGGTGTYITVENLGASKFSSGINDLVIDETNGITLTLAAPKATLALVQGINTTDSPEFAGLTLTGYNGVIRANTGVLAAITDGAGDTILGMDAAGTASEYKALAGTTDQISISHGVGTITFSTPQDIATTSSPEFAGLTLTSFDGVLYAASGTVSALAYAANQFVAINDAGTAPQLTSGMTFNHAGSVLSYVGIEVYYSTGSTLKFGIGTYFIDENGDGTLDDLTVTTLTVGTLTGILYADTGLLSSITDGTADQLLGMDGAATGYEYKTLSGTTDQITVTHGIGTITLSVPQDIATTSSPEFAGLTLTGFGGVIRADSGVLSAITDGAANTVLGIDAAGTASEYKAVSGTADQITVTHGAGTITLSTPQDIDTGADVTFGSLTLTTALAVDYGGTGATTAQNARLALLPSISGNATKVLAVNAGETDVEWVAAGGGGGTPGGSSGDFQYNNAGSFAGGTALKYNTGGGGLIEVTGTGNGMSIATTGGGLTVTPGTLTFAARPFTVQAAYTNHVAYMRNTTSNYGVLDIVANTDAFTVDVLKITGSAAVNYQFRGGGSLLVRGTYSGIVMVDRATAGEWQFYPSTTLRLNTASGDVVTWTSAGNQTIAGIFQAQGAVDTTYGNLALWHGTKNHMIFRNVGFAAPTFTNRSNGTKVVFWPAVAGSAADYAAGIDASTLWFSVPTTSELFKWYGGTTQIIHLTGAGAMTLYGSFMCGASGVGVTTAPYGTFAIVCPAATNIISQWYEPVSNNWASKIERWYYINTTTTSASTVATLAMSNGYLNTVEVIINGGYQNSSGYAAVKFVGVFKYYGGTVTQIGSTTTIYNVNDGSAPTPSFSVSGTNVLIQIAPGNSNFLRWRAFVEHRISYIAA